MQGRKNGSGSSLRREEKELSIPQSKGAAFGVELYCQNPECGIRIWGYGSKYCSQECSNKHFPMHERLASKTHASAVPPVSPLKYPRSEDGKVILRPVGLKNKLTKAHLPQIPASQVGGVDWTFTNMFGSVEEGVRMVESLVAGQGAKAEQKWILFLLAYRNKQEEALALGREAPSLNSICALLEIEAPEFLGTIVQGIKRLSVALGQVKVAQAIGEVIESSLEAARDPEKGSKDREMLLKMGGMLEDKAGVSVSVNQQVGIQFKGEDLKAPLRQFKKEIEELDNIARDSENVVEGELVDEKSNSPGSN
jgi:hypothetical protein